MKISLAKFLTHYYGYHHPNILNLRHKDVKILFPEITRCSFQYAEEHPEEVAQGSIIYVSDAYSNLAPYLAPVLKNDFECEDFEVEKKKTEKLEKITEEDLKDLTRWELIETLRQYKDYCSCYRKIQQEMKFRGMKAKRKVKVKLNDEY